MYAVKRDGEIIGRIGRLDFRRFRIDGERNIDSRRDNILWVISYKVIFCPPPITWRRFSSPKKFLRSVRLPDSSSS